MGRNCPLLHEQDDQFIMKREKIFLFTFIIIISLSGCSVSSNQKRYNSFRNAIFRSYTNRSYRKEHENGKYTLYIKNEVSTIRFRKCLTVGNQVTCEMYAPFAGSGWGPVTFTKMQGKWHVLNSPY